MPAQLSAELVARVRHFSVVTCPEKLRKAVGYLLLAPVILATLGCQVTVTASSHDGNEPWQAVDGNLETRWSAQGAGEWLRLDLLQTKVVSGVEIAFYQGAQRQAYFDIELSTDGQSWQRVFQGQSSGQTASYERFSFTPANARYVRYVGRGNSQNDWNSLLEVRVLTDGSGQDGGAGDGDDTPGDTQAVWGENFENLSPGSLWKNKSDLTVTAGCGVGGGRCVRAAYRPASNGSPRLTFTQTLPPARSYTLNYDVNFESGFEWVKGGKLHGLGPSNPTTGCDDATLDGWSARVMWRREGELQIYTYDQHRENNCGNTENAVGHRFAQGRYQAVSLYVQVNEPAQLANGRIALYLDGEKIAEQTGLQLRATGGSATEINRFMFSTFFGGNDSSWAPSKTVTARFDNFAVYPGLRVRSAPGR
jgi:hypothetical protein